MIRNSEAWLNQLISRKVFFRTVVGCRPNVLRVNTDILTESPWFMHEICTDLVEVLAQAGVIAHEVDRVVGHTPDSVSLADGLAYCLSASSEVLDCLSTYTKKDSSTCSSLDWVFGRTNVRPGEKILLAQNVFVNDGSIGLTTSAIQKAGGIVLPVMVVIVNFTDQHSASGKRIISLMDCPEEKWDSIHVEHCQTKCYVEHGELQLT